jgi:preprotein translocase subunit SecA
MKLRSGIPIGAYAERAREQFGWIDRCASGVARLVESRWDARVRYSWVIAGVAKLEHEYEGLDDAQLSERGASLRGRLLREGPSKPLVVQTFTWIRETSTRAIGLRHRDTQLLAAAALFDGAFVQLGGGEGKGAALALAAAAVAACGRPCELISAREDHARVNYEAHRELFEALGLRVALVTGELESAARKAAYACDVTYVAMSRLLLDYLHDRVVVSGFHSRAQLSLRRLLDDAAPSEQLCLSGLRFALIDDVDQVLLDDALDAMSIVDPESESLGARSRSAALELARELAPGRDFKIDGLRDRLELTEAGGLAVSARARELGGAWSRPAWRDEQLRVALLCLHDWQRGRTHEVEEGQLVLKDEGRERLGREGAELLATLRSMEGVVDAANRDALRQSSLQGFMQRYLRVSGISSSLRGGRAELCHLFHIPAYHVPGRQPVECEREHERVFLTRGEKDAALERQLVELISRGTAVVVATRTMEAAQGYADEWRKAGLKLRLFPTPEGEFEDVAEPGAVTLVAQRSLRWEARAYKGEMHVICSEPLETRRHEDLLVQLGGRGSAKVVFTAYTSLDDSLIERHATELERSIVGRTTGADGLVPRWLARALVRRAQLAAERTGRHRREDLLRNDQRREALLAFGGEKNG